MGAGEGRFLGLRFGVIVVDCVGAAGESFLGQCRHAGVEDCM